VNKLRSHLAARCDRGGLEDEGGVKGTRQVCGWGAGRGRQVKETVGLSKYLSPRGHCTAIAACASAAFIHDPACCTVARIHILPNKFHTALHNFNETLHEIADLFLAVLGSTTRPDDSRPTEPHAPPCPPSGCLLCSVLCALSKHQRLWHRPHDVGSTARTCYGLAQHSQ
jgi:hypothetical protein